MKLRIKTKINKHTQAKRYHIQERVLWVFWLTCYAIPDGGRRRKAIYKSREKAEEVMQEWNEIFNW